MAGAYGRGQRGARKKRPRGKGASSSKNTKREREAEERKKAKRKKPVAPAKKRLVPKKRATSKKPAPKKKTTSKRKPAPKKAAAKKPKVAAKRTRAKKPTRAELAAQLAAEKRRARRLVRQAEKQAALLAETKLKHRVDRANARLRKHLKNLKALEGKAKRAPKSAGLKKAVVAERKAIAAAATAEALAIKELPTATRREAKESLEQNRSERLQSFRRAFRLAQQTGQLPKHTRLGNRVDSWFQRGVRRTIRIDDILSDALITEIMYRVDRASRQLEAQHSYSLWQAYAMMSGSGDDFFGSGVATLDTSMLPKADPDAARFQTRGYIESGYTSTREGMLHRFEGALEKQASAKNSIVYIHDVTIMYVTRKTEKERRGR